MNSTLLFETAERLENGAQGMSNSPIFEAKALIKSGQVLLGQEPNHKPAGKDVNRPHNVEKDKRGACNCWLCSDLDARFGAPQQNRYRRAR